jgi:hypothetical protein
MEEVTNKFISEYEKNFYYYKYINEIYEILEETKRENVRLLEKKNHIVKLE